MMMVMRMMTVILGNLLRLLRLLLLLHRPMRLLVSMCPRVIWVMC